jgi:diguanylate cyclase (GGDEF)-like protein/PAS domain S-box-containing protein
MRRVLPYIGVLAFVGAALWGGLLEPPERWLMDARFSVVERPASGDVVVVAIDPKSLRTLEVWPWARGYHATVLENLEAAGAAAVAFDLDFSSRSAEPEEDAELEGALAASETRVIVPSFRQLERRDGRTVALSLTEPLPRFGAHAERATINIQPDPGGLVRRYRSFDRLGARRVPTFAAALADRAGGPEVFYLDFGIDTDWIPRIPYLDVLTGQFDAETVRGKAVIIGATAVELGDTVAVPGAAVMPGPVLQALAYDSLVHGRALERTGPLTDLVLALVLTLLAVPLFRRLSWRVGLLATAALLCTIFGVALAVQHAWPLLLDVVPPMLVVVGVYFAVTAQRLERQHLRLLIQTLRMRRTETLMRHVVDNSFDAILTLDADGHIVHANPAAESMFGRALPRLTGLRIGSLTSLDEAALEDGPPLREALGHRAGGGSFPIEVSIAAIAGEERSRRVCFIRDVTERIAQRRALEHQATHDSLTRLPNRVLLRERVAAGIRESDESGAPLALMILDLDRFKDINDTLGHHVGDQLLQQIGERLPGMLRECDTVARLGGDEFAVLLPRADQAMARSTARRLIERLQQPFELHGVSLHVEASIGIAMYPIHGTGSTELIQRADVAMYVAKRARTEYTVYDPTADFTSVRNLTLSAELKRAIQQNELTLWFQPKVECSGGKLAGVEALVRWEHPTHGLLSPVEFIGVAEHSGLIRPLSQWVLRSALRQCASWLDRGLRIPTAVNLSARNLQEEQLPAQLTRLLRHLELPPDLLTLEITESVIMEDPDRAMAVVTDFSRLGVNIAIDDFGTGYSSLAYLKRLPAREIKIDRAFVGGIDHDREDAVIVRSTVEMAHNLGLHVVAEGVETVAVWEKLRSFGCDVAQGYYFSPPRAPEAFLEWLEESPWQATPPRRRPAPRAARSA